MASFVEMLHVYVCMCVCVYVRKHTRAYVCMLHTRVYVCAFMRLCVYAFMGGAYFP
jgi:hypothetical protein